MTTSATPISSRTAISEKDRFLKTFEKEAATTLKVLRAYPEAECALKPHERAKTALNLAWMFVMEQMLIVNALKGESIFGGGGLPKTPEGWTTIIETFERVATNCSPYSETRPIRISTVRCPSSPDPNRWATFRSTNSSGSSCTIRSIIADS